MIFDISLFNTTTRSNNKQRIKFYHPQVIHGWANFQLIAINNFHCTEPFWVFFIAGAVI